MDSSHFVALPLCTQNSYLAGSIMSQHVVRSWLNCLTLCILNENCSSVNVWENQAVKRNVTCQLNWSVSSTCSDLQTSLDMRYIMKKFASCADVKRASPSATDGEYMLWFGWSLPLMVNTCCGLGGDLPGCTVTTWIIHNHWWVLQRIYNGKTGILNLFFFCR